MGKYSNEIKKDFRKFFYSKNRPSDFSEEDNAEFMKEWEKWRTLSAYKEMGSNATSLCIVPETLKSLAVWNIRRWQDATKDASIEANLALQEYKHIKKDLEAHWEDPERSYFMDLFKVAKQNWVDTSNRVKYCKTLRKAAFLLYNRNF